MKKTDYWVTYTVKSNSGDEKKMIDLVNSYDLKKLLDLMFDGEIYDLYITNSAASPAILIDYRAIKALKMIITDFHDSALQSLQDELAD